MDLDYITYNILLLFNITTYLQIILKHIKTILNLEYDYYSVKNK